MATAIEFGGGGGVGLVCGLRKAKTSLVRFWGETLPKN